MSDASADGKADVTLIFPDVDAGFPDSADAIGLDADAHSEQVDVWTPAPCKSHKDCLDGFCVELTPGSGEFFCVPLCIEECPLDWACKAIYIDGPDPVSVCLPPGGPCEEQDLLADGKDEDCDGETDEDVPLGALLRSYLFGSGGGTAAGSGLVLRSKLCAPAIWGTSKGGGLVLRPGTGK